MYMHTYIHTTLYWPYTHICMHICALCISIDTERERETRPAQTRERERKLAMGCREIIGLKDGWMDGSVNTVLVHIYLYMGNTYIYMYTNTFKFTVYTFLRTYVRTLAVAYQRTYIHVHPHAHTYIHTHIHTLTY